MRQLLSRFLGEVSQLSACFFDGSLRLINLLCVVQKLWQLLPALWLVTHEVLSFVPLVVLALSGIVICVPLHLTLATCLFLMFLAIWLR